MWHNLPEVRFVVGFTQLHVAVLGEVEDDDEDEPDVLSPDVQPGPGTCDPQHPWIELRASLETIGTTKGESLATSNTYVSDKFD